MACQSNLAELSLCGILSEGTSHVHLNMLFDQLCAMRSLKCLDLSKNAIDPEPLNRLLTRMPGQTQLQALSLNNVGLRDVNKQAMAGLLRSATGLKSLSLSSN